MELLWQTTGTTSGVYAIVALAAFAGALIQGKTGLGFPYLLSPVAGLVAPHLLPATVMMLALVVNSDVAWRHWRDVPPKEVALVTVGRFFGTFAAGYLVSILALEVFQAVLGSLMLLAIGLSVAGVSARLTHRNLVLAGIGAGFVGTITTIGGVIVALLYINESSARIKGILGTTLVIGGVLAVSALALFGKAGLADAVYALAMAPPVVLGLLAARLWRGMSADHSVRRAVMIISALASAALVAKALYSIVRMAM